MPIEVSRQLQEDFGKKAIASVAFPTADARGQAWYGFNFRLKDCRLLSFDCIRRWCDIVSAAADDRKNLVIVRQTWLDLGKSKQASRLMPTGPDDEFSCSRRFTIKPIGNPKNYFTIELDVNDYRKPPFVLALQTPFRSVCGLDSIRFAFWNSVRKKLSCLGTLEVIGNQDKFDGCHLPDSEDWTFRLFPSESEMDRITVTQQSASSATETLSQIYDLIESLSAEFEFASENVSFYRTPSEFERDSSRMYESFRSCDFGFCGFYREDFSEDEIRNSLPSEGYWRLPLLEVKLRGNPHDVGISFIKTADEQFLEFDAPSKKLLDRVLKEIPWRDQLEFWTGEADERWGLLALTQSLESPASSNCE
ncbi:hypothetical protein RMSM_01681 [Rhodopirellula maiorica SM1]|uniref:Uncharacterized protein n=1 Tax=Rhodopirellula maiorica SM1 TaxID=1265738 RepID=M5S160_9BACT|nr:hypothetical protein [Rhodopirellula maiorica]EMI21387.1 hypothetical protein RMSM_01681 [Rhodopirellula maiorica SM1]